MTSREGWKIKHGTELHSGTDSLPFTRSASSWDIFASHTILCDRDDEIRVTFSQWNIVVCGMSSPLDKFQPIEETLGLCAAQTSSDTQTGLRVCFGNRLCKLKRNKMSSRPETISISIFIPKMWIHFLYTLFIFLQNCHAMKLNCDHWFLRSARQRNLRSNFRNETRIIFVTMGFEMIFDIHRSISGWRLKS